MIFLTKKFPDFKKLIFLFFFLFYKFTFANEGLVLHGGYTFETFPTQKSTSIYISIFNNSNEDIPQSSKTKSFAKSKEKLKKISKK